VMIVEAIGNVVLRNGQHVVCITLDVINNDPRRPRVDEAFRDNVPRPQLASHPVEQLARDNAASMTVSSISTGPYP
ncbi:hypothetical protein, partial [Stenotrophomonas maltophilia]|uniref:hypothetical protein n=1 Tax=Stenotrophomonas maltophilia TaxID=40324 RepID=UPI0013DAFD0A